MSRKFARIHARQAAKARPKKYAPRPHPEVTSALAAAGLNPDRVYGARRWERGSIDFIRLGGALHALTVAGWRVSAVAGPMVRYPAECRAVNLRGRVAPDVRAAQLRLEHERARGLAFVFDRTPESIDLHIERYRAFMAALRADPIARLAADANYAVFLTRGELSALGTFVSAFGKFHAAIGNGALTVSAGDGIPMTDEARSAAEKAYRDICAAIMGNAGPRALSACQDLAANRGNPDKWLLQSAAHAIDPSLPVLTFEHEFEEGV